MSIFGGSSRASPTMAVIENVGCGSKAHLSDCGFTAVEAVRESETRGLLDRLGTTYGMWWGAPAGRRQGCYADNSPVLVMAPVAVSALGARSGAAPLFTARQVDLTGKVRMKASSFIKTGASPARIRALNSHCEIGGSDYISLRFFEACDALSNRTRALTSVFNPSQKALVSNSKQPSQVPVLFLRAHT